MFDYAKHCRCDEVVQFTEKNLRFALHCHDSYEFLYCYDGVINVTIVDRIYRVRQGKCILIAPMQAHAYETSDYSKVFMCVFPRSLLSDFYEEYKDLEAKYPVFVIQYAEAFCKRLKEETQPLALKSMFYGIAASYVRHGSFEPRDTKKYEMLQSIISYVDSHCSEDISLKDLAAALGLSYNYLSALFNDAFDGGFMEIVNYYRINRAETLLLTTDKTVADIAVECGYGSLRSFNRNYKTYAGKTPTETRIYKAEGEVAKF